MFLMNRALEALNSLHSFSCSSLQNRFLLKLKMLLFCREVEPIDAYLFGFTGLGCSYILTNKGPKEGKKLYCLYRY